MKPMKKILLVEDTPDVLENFSELLLMEGYEIATAANGENALDKLLQYKPDLIITDLRMPKMDGFAFIEKLKTMDELKTIPVLVFSANAIPENEIRCLQLGAIGFLKKPCNTELLLSTVQAAFKTN